jgi:hypothetical protein
MSIIDTIIAAIHALIGGPKPYDQLAAELDAKAKGRNLNWRESIVDLLKLIGQDSSIQARAQMAREFGHDGPFTGTAEQNIALHRKVMDRLARN